MPAIQIKTAGKTSTIITCPSIREVFRLIEGRPVVIITDQNLDRSYGDLFPEFPKIVLSNGESSKSLETVRQIYEQLGTAEVDRDYTILGIGGGVVCDIAGFVASTYLRGLDFGFVATSLLAQVDASIGGKNGVNFAGAKNIIGTINQPRFVLCPLDVLETLPREQFINGTAEIIKTGAIGDADLLEMLATQQAQFINLVPDVTEQIIFRTLNFKAGIVMRDEREQGERRKLNFGHTIGHAIEIASGILHGQAVAIGMNMAAEISVRLGLLARSEKEHLAKILTAYELPTATSLPANELLPLIFKDKKRQGEHLRFVALKKLGSAEVINLSFNQIKEFLDDLCCVG
ncbi:MAG TPA: 3-dehydroquinate synthase [Candidatus Marinimicrobia bacterium]|nr:3-dehydroquinate synthase [Candidatus Neomarinimicrobiota bacterium]